VVASVVLLILSVSACWHREGALLTASTATYSVTVAVQVSTPLQPVPITIELERVDVYPPGNYYWTVSSNLGSVSPNSGDGELPVEEVCFTYSPGSTPVDYGLVSILLTVHYYHPYVNSATQQYTVTFSPRYQVNVVSERGTTSGTGLHEGGSYVCPSVTPSDVLESDSTRHRLNGWIVQISGQAQRCIGTAESVRVTQVATLSAIWKTSYMVTFSAPGNHTALWADKDSRLSFTSPQCIQDGQAQRRTLEGYNVSGAWIASSSCSVIVSSPLSISAVYRDEFYVGVTSDHGTTSGSGWYPIGAAVSPGVTPTILNDSSVARWRFTGWNATFPVSVTGPVSITAQWAREYHVKVGTCFSGTVVDGWYASGTTLRINGSQPRQFGNDTLSIFSRWSDGNAELDRAMSVTGPLSLSECRDLYYRVAVTPTHPRVTLAGDSYQGDWFRAGTTARAVAPAEVDEAGGVKLSFEGFLRPTETNRTEITFVVEGPVEVVARWRTYFLITADGLHADVTGAGWYPENAMVSLGVLEERVQESAGSRWVFEGWDRGMPFIANGTFHVTAIWRHEYYVMVSSPFGQTTGGGWYVEGDSVHLSVEPTAVSLANGSRATFRCWRVNGSDIGGDTTVARGVLDCQAVWDVAPPPSTPPPSSSPPHSPGPPSPSPCPPDPDPLPPEGNDTGGANATQNTGSNSTSSGSPAQRQYPRAFTLSLVTDRSSCSGAGEYVEGTLAMVRIQDEVIIISSHERYRFSGWLGESNALLSDLQCFNLTVNRNMTIRASWIREFLVFQDWLREDAPVVLAARPPIIVGDNTTEMFWCWLLQNGSRLYAESVTLTARDAIECSEQRLTCFPVAFRLCGIERAQVCVRTGNELITKSIHDSATLWLPRGSRIWVDSPATIFGSDQRNSEDTSDPSSSVTITGATELCIYGWTLYAVDGASNYESPLNMTTLWASGYVTTAVFASAAFAVVLSSVRLIRARLGAAASRKRSSPRWLSIEEYIRKVSKEKGRSR